MLKRILVYFLAGWFLITAGALVYLALFVGFPPREIRSQIIADPPVGGTAQVEVVDPALAALLYRYFPEPLSQHYEEVFIRDYFQDRRGGFLLDVGASHYKTRSTTHYMDVALGWHGIAIDAIAEFAPDYAKHRPRTKFFPVFVSDKSDDDVDFFVILNNSRLSTADKATAEAAGAHETRPMKTVTLNALLDSQGVKEIDLLSMDIELWEPAALAGFDIDRFKPELVVIESHPQVRDKIFDYFAKHDYVELAKYSTWDGRNAYFIPRADLAAFEARKAEAVTPAPAGSTPAQPAPAAP
jgi:hypothetical protein